MNKIENMARREEVEKALVLWDINNCPIPDGHDPLVVVQRIQTVVEKSGLVCRNGEISMTAIGNNLTEMPGGEDVMRKLSSIGISLKNSHNFQMDLYKWARKNPPPATMMVIDGHERLGWLACTLSYFEDGGYRILLAYPQPDLATPPFPRSFSGQWDWDAVLSYEQETTTTLRLVNKCGEYPWSCSVCFFDAPSFEDFTTHLKSVEHAFSEWARYATKNGVDRTNPANMRFGTSDEWDVLARENMLRQQELVRYAEKCGPGGFRPFGFRRRHFRPLPKYKETQSKY